MSARRILFVSEFWEGATASGLAHGLRALGHDIETLDYRDYLMRFGPTLLGRIAARLAFGRLIAAFNRAVVQTARQSPPDIFLTVKGTFISADTLAELRRLGIVCVNFYPDVAFAHPGLSEAALKAYDLLVTTKAFQMEWLAENLEPGRAAFVAHGYSADVHVPVDVPQTDADYDWDICYIGNASPYKRDWLARICSAHAGRKIAVVGHRWHRPEFRNHLAGATLLPPLHGRDYARLASRSRINLSFHYGPHGPQGWEDKVSTRSFELPACKGFMLHIDNDEIRSLYDVGQEIDVFATPEQLFERIGHYLDEPDTRRAMIEAAYARAVPAYSLDARAAELMAAIDARPG